MGMKSNRPDVAYTQQAQEEFQEKKFLYIFLISCILTAITVQSALWRFTEPFLDSLGAVLEDRLKENLFAQMIGAPIMIILQINACLLPFRSARSLKLLKICRLLLQVAYIVFHMEITVVSLANSGNNALMAPAALFFIELLFLSLGFLKFEPPGIENIAPFTIANLLLIIRCKVFQYNLMIPFIVIVLIEAALYIQGYKIDKELFAKSSFTQHNGEVYQSFFNLLPEGVAILADGKELKYANASLHRILGCDERNILNQLLDLGNVNAPKSEEGDKKHESKLKFQKIPAKTEERPTKNKAVNQNKLFVKRYLLPEDTKIAFSQNNVDMRSQEKTQQAKARLEQIQKARSQPKYNRAKTYDGDDKRSRSASVSELPDHPTVQLRNNVVIEEEPHVVDREKSDDKESIMLSPGKASQSRVEMPAIPTANLIERESELPSEDYKRSGNASPKIGNWGQKSFIRKKTFQQDSRLSSEISFVGPMRITQLGQLSQPNAVSASQSSNQKVYGSQILSGDITPISGRTLKVSLDNFRQQRFSLKQQKEAAEKNSSEKAHQVTPINAFVSTAPTTKKLQQSKKAHFFKNKAKNVIHSDNLADEAGAVIINMDEKKDKKLTLYTTTLKDMRLAYSSIMKRLNKYAKVGQRKTTANKREWSLPSLFDHALFRKLKGYLFRNKNNHTNLQQASKQLKEEDIKLNIEEEDYCIIMNSKLKLSETKEKFLEIKLTPTLLNGTPLILVLVKDMTERDLVNRFKETNNYKNTIMASVSHELKTPLNCILAMQEMIRPYIDEELAAKYLNPAINSSKLLMSMVNDILDFGQIQAGIYKHAYELFSLKEVLQEAQSLFEIPAKNRKLELKFEYDPKIPRFMYSDPNRIRQIVINLLNNAIKYTYNGSITLKAISQIQKRVCIEVTDTGSGIKAENVKEMLTAFGRLENDQLSSNRIGIGLTISQSLANRLGPKDSRGIKVRSEFGKGSCFYFTIESRLPNNKINSSQIKLPGEGEEEQQLQDEEKIQALRIEPEEEKKEGEEKKDDEVYEIGETSGCETMRLGFNMVLLNRMAKNVAEYKNEHFKGTLQRNEQSYDSQNGDYGSRRQGLNSPIFSAGHISTPKADDTDITPVHQQRALEVISLQLNNQAVPTKLISPMTSPSKLNFSFYPQTASHLELETKLVQTETAYLNQHVISSHIELAGVDQVKTPKAQKNYHVSSFKISEDLFGKKSILDSLNLKSRDASPVNFSGDKIETLKLQQPASMDFLKPIKSTGDVKSKGDVKSNAGSQVNVSTKISSIWSQNQKPCSCEDILIVDDNDFNLLALRQILESFQFAVATAYNGEIAIKKIKEKTKSSCCKAFQLVFMDCDMPVKDGFETTIELRALQKVGELPAFPIIAATSFVNEREVNRCFECGMDAYLNKPVNKDKMTEVIKKYYKR